jgi:hypothetical protein
VLAASLEERLAKTNQLLKTNKIAPKKNKRALSKVSMGILRKKHGLLDISNEAGLNKITIH